MTSVYSSSINSWCKIKFSKYGNPLYYAHNLYVNGSLLTNLDIPNDIADLNHGLFSGCTSLISVNIPENVKKIGSNAFNQCENIIDVYFT